MKHLIYQAANPTGIVVWDYKNKNDIEIFWNALVTNPKKRLFGMLSIADTLLIQTFS